MPTPPGSGDRSPTRRDTEEQHDDSAGQRSRAGITDFVQHYGQLADQQHRDGDSSQSTGTSEQQVRPQASELLAIIQRRIEQDLSETVNGIRYNLVHNYENTVKREEDIIQQLSVSITQGNLQLSGRVGEILTTHGRAYQNSVNQLDAQVLNGTMDQDTRNSYEILYRAYLYANRIAALKRLRDDLRDNLSQ